MKESERLEYIDWAKGGMILLVIVGHICQYYFSREKDEPLFRFIYSFHMPLFFLLSGYVLGVTQKKLQSQPIRKWLWHKTQTLLIPFVFWGLFVYRFIDPIRFTPFNFDSLRLLVEKPDNNDGAWFLISLFCIQVVCYPVFRYNKVWAWFVPLTFLIGGTLLGGSFFYCNTHHYLSFLAGFLLFKYQHLFFRADVATAALLCFVVAECFHPHPLLCTLSAGIVLLYTCKAVSFRGGWLSRKLSAIGRNTMSIYLLHFLFVVPFCTQEIDVSSFRMTPVLALTLVIAFVIALICVYIARITTYFPILNLMLFGKKIKTSR